MHAINMYRGISKDLTLCALSAIVFFTYYAFFTDYAISRLYGNYKTYKFNSVYNSSKYKFILLWTSPKTVPFVYMGVDRNGFIRRNCSYTNCVVTSDRSYLDDLTKFDVIMFHGPELVYVPILNKDLPKIRAPHQKYVFASMESSHFYPICSRRFDGFFNWTWTFRLDSDARWGYILIKDSSNIVIGPNKIMHWIKLDDMDPVSEDLKAQLGSKSRAAVWFVSNCNDKSGRKEYADKLKIELATYNLTLDVYGMCGTLKCDRYNSQVPSCDRLIKDHYYFYLSFENSFSEDYVTEKLLRPLIFDSVPIVLGFANYTRFMPDGIYLNAKKMSPEALAAKMSNLILNPEEYFNYFRWKNHYSYHSREETSDNNDYCNFCALVNNEKKMKTQSVILNFHEWWDNPVMCSR